MEGRRWSTYGRKAGEAHQVRGPSTHTHSLTRLCHFSLSDSAAPLHSAIWPRRAPHRNQHTAPAETNTIGIETGP